jgi:hypothetical protein
MARAFFLASALLEAPQAWRDFSRRVGLPSESCSGPFAFPIRARKDALRGLSPLLTGRLRFRPSSRLIRFRPDSERPPFGFLSEDCMAPSILTHQGKDNKQLKRIRFNYEGSGRIFLEELKDLHSRQEESSPRHLNFWRKFNSVVWRASTLRWADYKTTVLYLLYTTVGG